MDDQHSQHDDEAVWASRAQATRHQLRRLSAKPSTEELAARERQETLGSRSTVLTDAQTGAPSAFLLSATSVTDGQPSLRLPAHATPVDHTENRPLFASTVVPSLRTLSDEFASLQLVDFFSRPTEAAPTALTRLSSAPVSRGPTAPTPSTPVFAADGKPCLSHPFPKAVEPCASESYAIPSQPSTPPVEFVDASLSEQHPLTPATMSDEAEAPLLAPVFQSSPTSPAMLPITNPSPTEKSEPSRATTPVVSAERQPTGSKNCGGPASPRPVEVAADSDNQPSRERRSLPYKNRRRSPRTGPVKSPLPTISDEVSPTSRCTRQEPAQLRDESPSTLPNENAARNRDGRIKVVIRTRPFNQDEGGVRCVEVRRPGLTLSIARHRVDLSEYTERTDFAFDDAFDETVTTEEIYGACVRGLLDATLQGGSASVFAYGQTGSGKTYTMMGDATPCEGGAGEKGLYFLAAAELFDRISPSQALVISFYEIYCNSLFDLLNARAPVVLREDANRKVNICGLSWHDVKSPVELWELMTTGLEQRRTGSTSANERSSRSHAVMSIQIKDAANDAFAGVLNFVDLAGSERGVDTASNDRLTRLEGAEINKSLLSLKECIRSLDEKKRHIPFRGSRLTEVLRDSFTGNTKTVMIANVSPSSVNYEHTANTLRYAFRVKGLSVASVVPSKARNAPRPYYPRVAERHRSNLAPSPPSLRDVDGRSDGASKREREPVAGHRPRGSVELSPSDERPRHHRLNINKSRGRRDSSKAGRHRSSSPSTLWTAEDAAQRARVARAHPQLSPSSRALAKGNAPRRGGEALEADDNSATSLSTAEPPSGLPCLSPSHSPLFPLSLNGHSQLESNTYLFVTPSGAEREVSTGSGALRRAYPSPTVTPSPLRRARELPNTDENGHFVTRAEFNALELRLRKRIMRQLQQDIGSEIQEAIDERDELIARLRTENAMLRQTVVRLEAAQGSVDVTEAGHRDQESLSGGSYRSGSGGGLATQRPAKPAWLEM